MSTLLELYQRGAQQKPAALPTKELGKALGLSQQAISKHLLLLEEEGMIHRERAGRIDSILITPKGSDAVLSVYMRLKRAVEGLPRTLAFHGRVFTGLGEGAYYVTLEGYRRQFRRLLGLDPYPGTLNLSLPPAEVDLRRQLRYATGLEVKGFVDSKRTYGPVRCFKAEVSGGHAAAVLDIERTHHGESVLEVISPDNLRKELSLKDGDSVSVTVYAGD